MYRRLRRLVLPLVGLGLAAGGCTALNSNYSENTSAQGAEGSADGSTMDPSSSGSAATSDASTAASESSPPTSTTFWDPDSSSGTPEALLFEDDDAEDFGAGSSQRMHWQGALVLDQGSDDGRHVSRVFDAQEQAQWVSLRWAPSAPYGIGMAEAGHDESDYPEGGVDRDRLRLLLRMDEPGPVAAGTLLEDTSGLGHHGKLDGADAQGVSGVFGRALQSVSDSSDIQFDSVPLAPGTSAFTWALWFRGEDCNNTTIMALDSPSDLPTTSMFMMCADQLPAGCTPQQDSHVFVRARDISLDSADLCSTTRIDDGRWHLIVLRRADSNVFPLALFVDGYSEHAAQVSPGMDFGIEDDVVFTVAGQRPDWPGVGVFDEVAVWHRALDDEEIESLYLRGRRRLTLQVRACQEHDCSDAPPFVGPDGTPDTVFVDPGPGVGHEVELHDLYGVALQYQLVADRDPGIPTPAVHEVSAVAIVE